MKNVNIQTSLGFLLCRGWCVRVDVSHCSDDDVILARVVTSDGVDVGEARADVTLVAARAARCV